MLAYSTVRDYIKDVRVLLQDKIKPFRYEDSSLITALNVTILETRRIRADLFIGQKELPQYTEVNDEPVPIEPQFRLAIAHGITAHALKRDQEDIQDARSTAFENVFYHIMVGGSTPGISQPAGAQQREATP